MDKISSLVDEKSLFFLISLKSCVRPISANGRLYSLCILPGLGAITYNLSPSSNASSIEEALLLGERLYVMAPRPGRIHKEYNLPFAEMGLTQDLREIKKNKDFSSTREEILSMIWNMEEEIMGKEN